MRSADLRFEIWKDGTMVDRRTVLGSTSDHPIATLFVTRQFSWSAIPNSHDDSLNAFPKLLLNRQSHWR